VTVVLFGVLAGLVAMGATVAIERWGGVTGGLVATLPSTILPAAWGMFAATGGEGFVDAMAGVPPGMLLNVLFLLLWRELPPRLPRTSLRVRLVIMTTIALGAWLLGAVGVVLGTAELRRRGIPSIAVAAATTGLIAALGIVACWRPRAAPRGSRSVAAPALLARGILAGMAIAAALVIAAHGGGLAAGVASVFPAIFLTTMVSLWLAQGEAVPGGAVGPMMLGSTGIGAYALIAAAAMPAWGPLVGTVLAWLGAVLLVNVPAWAWLRRR
jgi:hypothetical protein